MSVTRRGLLTAAALFPLAGCSADEAPPAPAPAPAPSARVEHDRLVELERSFQARLGVFALDTGTGATVEHRADERFAFCSTFKAVAVAGVLSRNPLSHLDTVVRYGRDDLTAHAPVTRENVRRGMTIRRLCDAAIRFSDGTAGNLLLRDLGGPAALTAYARSLGDTVTRMDRTEPDITGATPGDPRDTSSPRALGGTFRSIVLGDALPAGKRAVPRDLLERNTTGDRRIRAGLPHGWTVADKTGSGSYGTANDIAIAWPPGREPLVIAIMTSRAKRDAERREELLARAAAYVADAL